MSKKEKFDLYQTVTDKITAQLEAGTVPWHRPWGLSEVAPRNYISKKPYKGINTLLLGMSEYASPFWMTFKQAQSKGGQVRKGEKSTLIVFWKLFDVDVKVQKKSVTTTEKQKRPFLRYYSVFNAEQIDGIDFPEVEKGEFAPHEQADAIMDHFTEECPIQYGGDRAYYHPAEDRIQLPLREQFESEDAFYATAFHEMVHATGHESRLKRDGITKLDGFASEQYGKEELIAEMGSAFVSAEVGIERAAPSASYVASWLETIKGDKKLVVLAGFKAAKAAEYLLGAGEPTEEAVA